MKTVCFLLMVSGTLLAYYPSGEAERQWQVLKFDLTQRARFEKFAPETYCSEALIKASDTDPLDVLLRRTVALLADLRSAKNAPALDAEALELDAVVEKARGLKTEAERRSLFDELLKLRRRIAFANPLLNFRELLFLKRDVSRVMEHCCDQFYGQQQQPGGGLFILKDPFGAAPELRNVFPESVSAGFEGGSFLSPALSYDAGTLVFAFVSCKGSRRHISHLNHAEDGHWEKGFSYHLYAASIDGNNLKQLTDGTFNDIQPCFTPAGRVAFISERRGGYLRCGRLCPNYTLFDMLPDGSDMRCLSFHETNEWSPAVTHDGMIVWTRWDYVDRHGCTAHHPWLTTPDGRNPRPIHGNYSYRSKRADMEMDVRPIPDSHKFVATGAPHHGQAFGSLVIVDPRIEDDDAMAPVKRLTPDVGFPESQGGKQCYGTAWPLSESYFLAAYEPEEVKDVSVRHGYAIYLVDKFGNKELVYRDPKLACMSPIPLVPRKCPPVIPEQRITSVPAHRRTPSEWRREASGEGVVTVADVYKSFLPWPKDGTKITALRIWKIFPLSVASAEVAHNTGIQICEGYDSVNLTRAMLGTVPVEKDGSAHFKVPSGCELYFQALDANGCAVQSMRSATALVPGEQLSCQGCHEPKGGAPERSPRVVPLAMKRMPSVPSGTPEGANPFSYPRLVQPILNKHCVACHAEKIAAAKPGEKTPPRLDGTVTELPAKGWMNKPTSYTASFVSLTTGGYAFADYGSGRNWNSPKFYRTIPGEFGARASKLYAMLRGGHKDVKLSPEEMNRLIVWLDSVSQFYGVYEKAGGEEQLRGGIALPTLE